MLPGPRSAWYGGVLLLFAAFVLLLYPAYLTGNEEGYFGRAHRLVAPEAFPPYTAFFDRSQHLLLFKLIAGYLVALFGTDAALVILRLTQAGLYAVGLSLLAGSLRLSAVEALGALAWFLEIQFELPGGSWLFHGVEAKTLAYGLALIAVAAALEGRRNTLVLCATLAAYFHFQVGGFWGLFGCAVYGFVHRRPRAAAVTGGVFLLALAPLAGVIAYQQLFALKAFGTHELSANYIYGFVRHPHHTAPFLSGQMGLWARRTVRFLAYLGVVFLLAWALRAPGRATAKALGGMLTIVGGVVLLGFSVSWFDRETAHFAKFYLFRPVSMATLLALLAGLALLQVRERVRNLTGRRVGTVLTALAAGALMVVIARQTRHPFWVHRADAYQDLVAAVRSHTGPRELVVLEKVGDENESLPRRFGRSTLVHWTFVPTNPADIHEWYDRIGWRKRLFETGCVSPLLRRFPVRYLVLLRPETRPSMANCGDVIWANAEQTLIRVRRPD